MKNALLTFYLENYQSLADLVLPERDKYCARHGYEHVVKVGPYHNEKMYYAYQRLIFVRDYLTQNKDVQFLFILNIQSVITNHTKKIEDYTDDTYDFWITKDINFINFGSSIIRNCHWGIEWLDFLISKEPEYRNDCWREQRACIDNWWKPKWCHRINLLPQNTINSYFYDLYKWSESTSGHHKKGDYILSLPGLDLKQRIDLANSQRVKDLIIY